MKKFFGAAITLAALAAVVACSESSTSNNDPSNPGNGGDGGGGGGGGDGGNNPGPGPGTKVKAGTVTMTQTVFSAAGTEVVSTVAAAGFYEGTLNASGSGDFSCKESKEGDCTITECDLGPTPDGGTETDAGTTKSPHAGEIAIKSASEMKLTPDADGKYEGKNEQSRLWTNGGDISVKAAGADVPAFEKSLKAPSAVKVTAPAWPALGTALEIDRANDLDITWSDGGAGSVQAMVSSSSDDNTKFATVSCVFKSDTGGAKIPKAALSKLIAGDRASIYVSAATIEEVTAGDWKVSVMAMTPATTSGGDMASGQAQIK
jgi:hypothetical protein